MPATSDDLTVAADPIRHAVEALEPMTPERKLRSLSGVALLIGLAAALPAHATTIQKFDGPGTAYTLTQHQNAPGAAVLSGGPTGNFLRLTRSGSQYTTNSIAFDLTDPGARLQIVTEFDFRIGAGADGLGVVLLNTSFYGTQGSSPIIDEGPHPPVGSLALGFNTFQNWETADPNNNFLRLYYDAQLVTTVAQPGVVLSSGQWIHARFGVTATPGGGLVSLQLTPSGSASVNPLADFLIPSYAPYESRVAFGARTGLITANHDIDNVMASFVPEPSSGLLLLVSLALLARHRGDRAAPRRRTAFGLATQAPKPTDPRWASDSRRLHPKLRTRLSHAPARDILGARRAAAMSGHDS